MSYYGGSWGAASTAYVVQPQPSGLCDAIFRALPLIGPDEHVLIGLPDTIWFPENAYQQALRNSRDAGVNLVCFPVVNAEAFDAVVCDEQDWVQCVEVKQKDAHSHWIWGAVTASGEAFHQLQLLWEARHRRDEYLGHLLNAYIEAGNPVRATHCGEKYMDVGTLDGYHAAQDFLRSLRHLSLPEAA